MSLFGNRPLYDNPLGGDAIQMLETKKWLESLYGFHISVITDPKELTDDFDIVHIFNFSTYEITNRFMEKAHQLGIPIVSSCIYWDYSYSIPPLHYFFWISFAYTKILCAFLSFFIWKYYCLP